MTARRMISGELLKYRTPPQARKDMTIAQAA